MSEQLPRRKRPCAGCPFRSDVTGVTKVFGNLADYAAGTVGGRGAEMPVGAELFGCHLSRRQPGEICAGWLAVAGYDHLGVRLAVARGLVPSGALEPGESWPPCSPRSARRWPPTRWLVPLITPKEHPDDRQ